MRKSLRSLTVMAMLIVMVVANSYAYTAQYFRQFLKREIEVTVVYESRITNTRFRTKNIYLYLQKIDTANGILIGKTNSGHVYIEVDSIVALAVTEQSVHKIHNPHR